MPGLCRWLVVALVLLTAVVLPPTVTQADDPEKLVLFDGRTLEGWEGNEDWFRVEDKAIVGGSLDKPIPRNEFLTTKRRFADFELTLEFRVVGERTNAGIQVRSERIPDHHEMIGYQADIGPGNLMGALYDESRRRKVLTGPTREQIDEFYKPDEWNHYRIRCEGRRVQLWINGTRTVNYTEPDESLEQNGLIGLQIHSGPPGEIWYRNLVLIELKNQESNN